MHMQLVPARSTLTYMLKRPELAHVFPASSAMALSEVATREMQSARPFASPRCIQSVCCSPLTQDRPVWTTIAVHVGALVVMAVVVVVVIVAIVAVAVAVVMLVVVVVVSVVAVVVEIVVGRGVVVVFCSHFPSTRRWVLSQIVQIPPSPSHKLQFAACSRLLQQ